MSRIPPTVENTNCVALVDMDGDGDLDLLEGNHRSAPDRLLLNDGTGSYAEALMALPAELHATSSLSPILRSENRVWMNDGSGRFTDVTSRSSIDQLRDKTEDLALADLDGDGRLDLFVASDLFPDQLYFGGGNCDFAGVVRHRVPREPWHWITQSVDLGDVDGDGDLDAVFGNLTGRNRLYENSGNGMFRDVTLSRLPSDSDETRAIALADFDGDGDLDVISGNRFSPNRLYRNHGGTFTLDVVALPDYGDQTLCLAHGDLDMDMDLDLFVGSWGYTDRIWVNLTRHLDTPIAAKLGSTLILEAHSQSSIPGTTIALPWVSPARLSAAISIPPHGALRIDPRSWVALPPIVDSGNHSGRLSALLPRRPWLANRSLYFQAVMIDPARPLEWRLSNPVSDRIMR